MTTPEREDSKPRMRPTDPAMLERLAEAMGEPVGGRQRLLEAYRRATRRARRVVMTKFWGGRG